MWELLTYTGRVTEKHRQEHVAPGSMAVAVFGGQIQEIFGVLSAGLQPGNLKPF